MDILSHFPLPFPSRSSKHITSHSTKNKIKKDLVTHSNSRTSPFPSMKRYAKSNASGAGVLFDEFISRRFVNRLFEMAEGGWGNWLCVLHLEIDIKMATS